MDIRVKKRVVKKAGYIARSTFPFIVVSLIALSVFLSVPSYVSALNQTPYGPTNMSVLSSTRRLPTQGLSLQAQAGNVSELYITFIKITSAWHGFVGNVSGEIVLDDASNYTLYNWELSAPSGEIYAVNHSSVSWSNIKCFNLTSNLTDGWTMNESTVESDFGILSTHSDGLGETFNMTYNDTDGFKVGAISITQNLACPMTYMYVNESFQTGTFQEVLLTDNSSLVFTSILEDDADGFKSTVDPWDFEMIVLEDGHPGQEENLTSYWFFLEIE